MVAEQIVYCLTREHDLAARLEERLHGAIAFFFNDAARLHQAVSLRAPDLVLVDTRAIRPEYGDAGLGPVVEFLHTRVPAARVTVRPASGVEHLVAAEAGPEVTVLPSEMEECIEAMTALISLR